MLAASHANPVYSTRRIPIDTKDKASKKFSIGLSVTHVYGIEVMADTHDQALLKMDDWLRGNLPANAMKAKIRSSNVDVIGLGVVAYGRISEVGELAASTREERQGPRFTTARLYRTGKRPVLAWCAGPAGAFGAARSGGTGIRTRGPGTAAGLRFSRPLQ